MDGCKASPALSHLIEHPKRELPERAVHAQDKRWWLQEASTTSRSCRPSASAGGGRAPVAQPLSRDASAKNNPLSNHHLLVSFFVGSEGTQSYRSSITVQKWPLSLERARHPPPGRPQVPSRRSTFSGTFSPHPDTFGSSRVSFFWESCSWGYLLSALYPVSRTGERVAFCDLVCSSRHPRTLADW